MPLTRKCRCVRVSYANDMHVDIVPHVILSGWREVIVNRDENIWEDTNPQGFTDWMKKQDQIAGRDRKSTRLNSSHSRAPRIPSSAPHPHPPTPPPPHPTPP